MLSINIKYIEDLDLSINEVMCLYKIKYPELTYNDVSHTYKVLQEKKFIKIYYTEEGVKMLLREKSEQLLEDMESQCPPADEKLVKKVSARHINNMLEGNVNINTWGQIQDNMAFVIQEWLKEGFDVEDVVLYLQAWAQELGGEVGRDAFN